METMSLRTRNSFSRSLEAGRTRNKEAHALDLLNVVETKDADECVRVVPLALTNFIHNITGIGSTEHRELPHSPVASIVVGRSTRVLTEGKTIVVEFNARDKTVVDHVGNLSLHIFLSEVRHVRHSLEAQVVGRVNNFLAVSLGNSGTEGRSRSHSTSHLCVHGFHGRRSSEVSSGKGDEADKADAESDVSDNAGGKGELHDFLG